MVTKMFVGLYRSPNPLMANDEGVQGEDGLTYWLGTIYFDRESCEANVDRSGDFDVEFLGIQELEVKAK